MLAEEYVEAMREGVRVAAGRGVTALHDKDGWLGAIGLWQRLEQRGGLPLRVWQSTPAERVGDLRELGLRSGAGSPLLRLGYLKTFMDGTLGSQTAWMSDGSGVVITTSEELEEIVRTGAEAGWPLGVHAIGDAANRAALDAFERSRDVWQPLGLRQRIEHAQCLAPDDVARFAELGIAVSVQFTHAPSDEQLAKRYWVDRLHGTYSFRSLLETGALLANGSDAPVEELEPWAGVVAAVLDHWREDQRLRSSRRSTRSASRPPGCRTTSASEARSCPAATPTSSCSTATRSRCKPEELREVRVVATMSAAAGRTTRRPGIEREPGRRTIGAMAIRTMNPVHEAGECAVAATAEIIGAKWTALLVHDLSEGPRRFSELERSCPGSARARSPSGCARSRRTASSSGRATPRRRRASSTR